MRKVTEANAYTAVVVIVGARSSWKPGVIVSGDSDGLVPGDGRRAADPDASPALRGRVDGCRSPFPPTPAIYPSTHRAATIAYDSWWGQRKLDRDGHPAAYPFGFGLGYTTFDMKLVDHRAADGEAVATVHVRNTGQRAGFTVAQVYAISDAADAVPQLVGFRRVELPAGGQDRVVITLDLTPTMQRDPETRTWSRRPGEWGIVVTSCSPGAPTKVRTLLTGSGAR